MVKTRRIQYLENLFVLFFYGKQKHLAFIQEKETPKSVKKEYKKKKKINAVFSSILEILVCSPEDIY